MIKPLTGADQPAFRMDLLDLLAVQGTLKSLLQHHSSKASILRCSAFFNVDNSLEIFFFFPKYRVSQTKQIGRLDLAHRSSPVTSVWRAPCFPPRQAGRRAS